MWEYNGTSITLHWYKKIYRVSCVMWAKIKNIGQIYISIYIYIYIFLIIIINRLVKVVQEPEEFQQTYNVKIEILSCIMTKW